MTGADDLNAEKIRMYMKQSKSDITHMNACRSIFLETDVNETGLISKWNFLIAARKGHFKFNEIYLNSFLSDI